jgi:putative toxin-antitoxin system antitoxin component (TIGR02293 family)
MASTNVSPAKGPTKASRRSGKGSASEAFAQSEQAAETGLNASVRFETRRKKSVEGLVTYPTVRPKARKVYGKVTPSITVYDATRPTKKSPEHEVEVIVQGQKSGVVSLAPGQFVSIWPMGSVVRGTIQLPGRVVPGNAPTGLGVTSFADVFEADPQCRIWTIKSGIPPSAVDGLAKNMSAPATEITKMLGLSRSTVARKKTADETPLSTNDSEKVVGLAKLVGQVEVMVRESGNPDGFDAGKWLNTWLNKPIAALNGKKPVEFMDTAEGQNLISNLLAQIQHGVYA